MLPNLLFVCLAVLCLTSGQASGGEPLKVYILCGQSNMQGHAHVRTFEHIGMDPKTAEMLKEMQKEDGSHRVCKDVWISSIGSSGEEEKFGRLTVGYGASRNGPKIGPEYTFGIYRQKAVGKPILIIKTAWGGKSINTDFRPPSAGPYVFNEQQIANLKKGKKDIKKVKADRAKATGRYYKMTIAHVKKVLADIKRVYPNYNANDGYELAGFVWFQGWNDMVDRGTYPNRGKSGGYEQYSNVLAHFIRDVRRDLSAPKMPFVIGVMGVGGPTEKYGKSKQRIKPVHTQFRKAMAAPAALEEFKGNVRVVLTEKYWDMELDELGTRWGKVQAKGRQLRKDKKLDRKEIKKAQDALAAELFTEREMKTYRSGTSNAAYHYLGSSKILGQIGRAFAEALQ